METEMAVKSQSLLVNKMTAIILVVFGFLILASGYRYGSPSSLIGGCLVLAVGIVLLVLSVVRRNSSGSAG
jgi:uncharacterized membrane protein